MHGTEPVACSNNSLKLEAIVRVGGQRSKRMTELPPRRETLIPSVGLPHARARVLPNGSGEVLSDLRLQAGNKWQLRMIVACKGLPSLNGRSCRPPCFPKPPSFGVAQKTQSLFPEFSCLHAASGGFLPFSAATRRPVFGGRQSAHPSVFRLQWP